MKGYPVIEVILVLTDGSQFGFDPVIWSKTQLIR